jgi:hypothetical protein
MFVPFQECQPPMLESGSYAVTLLQINLTIAQRENHLAFGACIQDMGGAT